ncbi:MAG: hypothetical protein ABW076_04645 [Candidatus Thiodiazotropha sp.]
MSDSRTIRLGWTFLLAVPALVGVILAIIYFYFPNVLGKPIETPPPKTSPVTHEQPLKPFSLSNHPGLAYDNRLFRNP